MNRISCGVCQDLLPLVQDGVACEDSVQLVREHLESCQYCRELAGNPAEGQQAPSDQKILFAVRKRLFLFGAGFLLLGSLLGIGLSNSMEMFYNFLIMPAVGAVGYFTFQKRWYLVPAGVFALSWIWLFIAYGLEGSFTDGIGAALAMPVWLSGIYTLLVALGIIIAALLRFAFGKDKRKEKSQ